MRTFNRFHLSVAMCVALALCLFASSVSAQTYYEHPLSWMNPATWGATTNTAPPAYVTSYTPTAYAQGAPSLPAMGGTCQTQTTCYPPVPQATVKYRWSYSKVERTRMVDVPVYDPNTGGLRVTQKPVTSYSFLPWLHLKPYVVASPAPARQTVSYTPMYSGCNPCGTCGSSYSSPSCSTCTPGATVTSPSGPPRTFESQPSAGASIQSNSAYPVRTQRTVTPEPAPSPQAPSTGPILEIPPSPYVASRGVPVYTAAMTRPSLGAPQPPSMLQEYTAARAPSPAPSVDQDYTEADRHEMWLRISAAKEAAREANGQ